MNSARIRQSGPDSETGFQVKSFKLLKLFPPRSEAERSFLDRGPRLLTDLSVYAPGRRLNRTAICQGDSDQPKVQFPQESGFPGIQCLVNIGWIQYRCRANSAQIRQSRPDSGLGFEAHILTPSAGVGAWLGSGPASRGCCRQRPPTSRRPALEAFSRRKLISHKVFLISFCRGHPPHERAVLRRNRSRVNLQLSSSRRPSVQEQILKPLLFAPISLQSGEREVNLLQIELHPRLLSTKASHVAPSCAGN